MKPKTFLGIILMVALVIGCAISTRTTWTFTPKADKENKRIDSLKNIKHE